jgi:hypothetical protein
MIFFTGNDVFYYDTKREIVQMRKKKPGPTIKVIDGRAGTAPGEN